MDGIDAVLVDLSANQAEILAANTFPWSVTLGERLQAAARGTFLNADQFAQLDAETGRALADAALKIIRGHDAGLVHAIGSHGQTLAHAPAAEPPYTLQMGNAAWISELTGITTVADFRLRDVAAGGQGAPLVPAFHESLFHSPKEDRVVINIGGIANITHLPAENAQAVSGFDTGPGNCLMDHWTKLHQGQPYDADGRFGAQGTVDRQLLAKMLADPYFAAAPPKSTGTDYFSGQWINEKIGSLNIEPANVQATLAALTARTIADAIRHQYRAAPAQALVCGGGAHNTVLMQALAAEMPCPVQSTAAMGIDPDWVEAVAFAWLAKQTLKGLPGNLPAVTGAAGPRVLGAIFPA